jgi:hypothetical protein
MDLAWQRLKIATRAVSNKGLLGTTFSLSLSQSVLLFSSYRILHPTVPAFSQSPLIVIGYTLAVLSYNLSQQVFHIDLAPAIPILVDL